jgi:hypothetical protein
MNHGIDFDDAAAAWRENKRRKGESFAYVCGFAHPNGRRCGRDSARGTALDLRNVICAGVLPLCRQHLMLEENRLEKLSLAEASAEKQSPPISASSQ